MDEYVSLTKALFVASFSGWWESPCLPNSVIGCFDQENISHFFSFSTNVHMNGKEGHNVYIRQKASIYSVTAEGLNQLVSVDKLCADIKLKTTLVHKNQLEMDFTGPVP